MVFLSQLVNQGKKRDPASYNIQNVLFHEKRDPNYLLYTNCPQNPKVLSNAACFMNSIRIFSVPLSVVLAVYVSIRIELCLVLIKYELLLKNLLNTDS
jgi:hypothetical protein